MALGQGFYGYCLDIFKIVAFFVACFMYSYQNNLRHHKFNTTFITIKSPSTHI